MALFGGVLEPEVVQRMVQGVSRVDCLSIVDDVGVFFHNMFEKFLTILMDNMCLYFFFEIPVMKNAGICCLLLVVCCLLSRVFCLLSGVWCLLSVVCWPLSAVCCLLSVV